MAVTTNSKAAPMGYHGGRLLPPDRAFDYVDGTIRLGWLQCVYGPADWNYSVTIAIDVVGPFHPDRVGVFDGARSKDDRLAFY